YAAFFSIALLLPLWMQRNLGYTAIWAGMATAPLGILPLLLTFFIGKYAARVDLRMLSSIAFLVMSGVCFLYSGFNLEVNFAHVAMVQLLLGLGVAFFFMPVLTILMSDLETNEIASGSGVATFLRTLGGSFTASIVTSMWDHRATLHHARLTEHITPYDPVAQGAVSLLGPSTREQSLALVNQMITQQGYQMSFNEIFHGLGWIFLALIAITWLTRPPFVAKAGPAAAGGH